MALTRAGRTLTILVRGEDDPDEGLSYLQNWWSKSRASGGSVSGMEKMLGRRLHELPDSSQDLAGMTLLAEGQMVIRTPVGIEDASPVPPSEEVTWQEAPQPQSFAIRPTITGSQYRPTTDADAADRSIAAELAEQSLESVPSTALELSPLSA